METQFDFTTFLIGFFIAALLLFLYFSQLLGSKIERLKSVYNNYLKRVQAEAQEQSRGVLESLKEKEMQIQILEMELAKQEERLRFAQEQITFLERTKEDMKQEFEALASQILEKNSQNLAKKQQDTLQHLLYPFAQNIKEFQQKVEQFYIQENKERFSLVKEIQNLKELNERISQDAINLTNALKGDNKLQGNWGEYILEKVLESSGLTKGREYEIQKEYQNEIGQKVRPDVVVHLPDNKDVIIDSKVSLIAYEQYHSSDNELERERYLKEHLNSIYMHIKLLSQKRYESIPSIKTLDFVLLFIPIEAAFMLAIEKDRHLYEKAYQKNIILVSPSTLLAVLRTIQHSWRYEYQNKNALIIAKKAGDLYDKFAGFLSSMEMIDTSLKRARDAYEEAFKKLSSGKGNLISRAEELKRLEGVHTKKIAKNNSQISLENE